MKTLLGALALAALLASSNAFGSTLPPVYPSDDGSTMQCEPDRGTATNPTFLVTSNWGRVTLHARGSHPDHEDPRQEADKCVFEVRFTGAFTLLGTSGGGVSEKLSTACVVEPGLLCQSTASIWFYVNLAGGNPGIRLPYELRVNGAVVAQGQVTIIDPPVPGREGETLASVHLPA